MKNIIYLLAFIIISFIGCSGTLKSDNNSGGLYQEEFPVLRFDKEMYEYLIAPDSQKEAVLKKNYPLLLRAMGRVTINNGDLESVIPSLKEYFSDLSLMKLYKDELSTFADLAHYTKELAAAQLLVEKNFSGKKLPQLSLHVSGYRENVIILQDMISVSADKYLGSEYSGYKNYFQSYERQQMQPQYLVRDFLKAWLLSDNIIVPANEEGRNLVMAMVDEGKILYTLSLLLPERNEEDIIGYTPSQLEWCRNNEKKIWGTIVKQNHLYSTDHMLIMRYVNDASATVPVGPDFPGRVGAWIGLKMIEKYVSKTGASLGQILNTDPQTILKDSKYNP